MVHEVISEVRRVPLLKSQHEQQITSAWQDYSRSATLHISTQASRAFDHTQIDFQTH